MCIIKHIKTMKSINHSLEIVTPMFLSYLKNFDKDFAKWIQYVGCYTSSDGKLFFKFKHSQNSLNFECYAGENIDNLEMSLKIRNNEIYEYFKKIKYDFLENN